MGEFSGGTSRQDERDSYSRERTLSEGLLLQLSILLQYRLLIAGCTLVAFVFAILFAVVSAVLPPERSPLPDYYEAYATLMRADEQGPDRASAMLSALGVTVPGTTGTDYGSIALRVLETRSFLDDVAESVDLAENYDLVEPSKSELRAVILANSEFSYDDRTGVLEVSYQHVSPEYAARVANVMVESLQEWFRSRGGLTRQHELETLGETIVEVEERIAALQAKIRAFQQEHGVLEVQEIAETQADLLADLQSQLVETEVQIRNQASLSRMADDPALARLRNQRDNLVTMIGRIENGYTGGDRRMPARDELPQLALELQRLRADLSIQQRIYQTISEQYEVARLTAESEPAFALLEAAEVPDEKAGPSRLQLILLITVGAFVASIFVSYGIHGTRGIYNDPRKRTILTGNGESRSEESA